MKEFKTIDFSAENLRSYWEGPSNRFARYTTYLSRGFGRFNEISKYLQIVLASWWTTKYVVIWGYSISPNWILVASIIGFPVLMAIGRWDLFKLQKAIEFITMQKSTITGYGGYNMTVKSLQVQQEILKELKKLNNRKN